MSRFDGFIKLSPDPEIAALRISDLLKNKKIDRFLGKLDDEELTVFFRLITVSNFLYNYICRYPETLADLNNSLQNTEYKPERIGDLNSLRQLKYKRLLAIAWQDIAGTVPYEHILNSLSELADQIIKKVLLFIYSEKSSDKNVHDTFPLCIFAMGKLGANELNFSSDVDLIFVCADEDDIECDYDNYITFITGLIRRFNRSLTDITENGFLYRVDMNIRPLGRSGPVMLSVTDTENYYAASTEAWERFAWLRARIVAGTQKIGNELLESLHPFIYMRTLSSDDLDRFVQIKKDMARMRYKSDSWNVKLGEGGIRDIEFFIQILQIANASQHDDLQATNTLTILDGLVKNGLLDAVKGNEIRKSYLFLRQLENRLQMVDEQQTHEVPNEQDKHLRIARSFGFTENDEIANVEMFDQKLESHKLIARQCFEQILPGH